MLEEETIRELNCILDTIGLSSRSSNKFQEMEFWLADKLGIRQDAVAVKFISAEKQVGNRLGELAQRRPSLAVILIRNSRVEQVAAAIARRMGAGGFLSSAAILEEDSLDIWRVVRLIEVGGEQITKFLSSMFPSAKLELIMSPAVIRAERKELWRDVAFSAAHKIGNPIFAISMELGPLEKRIREGRAEEALEVVKAIKVSVDKASRILNEFKSLAKAGALDKTNFLLAPLLEEPRQMLTSREVSFQVKCDPGIKVYGDRDRLAECFDELISNSLFWMKSAPRSIEINVSDSPGSMPVGLREDLDYVVIKFSDNGRGVAYEDKSRIFGGFFSRRKDGLGLGLALVNETIEAHDGFISEVGSPPHRGAVFLVYLPAAKSR
jgi:signal transduction histidine kinase